MKFYAIALFLFIFNISIGAMNELAIVHTDKQMQTGWNTDINQIKNDKYSDTSVSGSDTQVNFGFGDFVKGFWYFIKAVGYATVGVFFMYTNFGLPMVLAGLFSLPVYLIYGVALAQFLANRGMKNMS